MRGVAALLLLVASAPRLAVAVTVTATIDPPRVAVGESADLSVRVEGTQSAPTPQIADTAGLSVSYVGPASQVSFVNGRVTASVTHHFTVTGTKPGRYTLGPITVLAEDRRHDAGTVSLELLASGVAAGDRGAAGDQVTLELSVPRTEVYVGERLPLGVKLTVGSVRVTDLQLPQVPGDGVAIDKLPTNPAQRQERSPRGVVHVVDFQTTLTPLKSGPLTVGPATMSLGLVVQGRRNRGFFGGFFEESRPIQVQSAPLVLNVLPLPGEGRPANFTGAVGRFTFDVTASPLEVAVGDPVTVRSVVRGTGSLDGVAPPAIPGGDALRVYPPQAGESGAGERTFEQVVIPLRDGPLTVPPLRWSYFDPADRTYRTIVPPPIVLGVRPSARAGAAPEIVGAHPAAPAEPERPETLGRDIVFIKDAPGRLRPIGARPYHAPVWWLAQLVPVAGFAAASLYARRRERLTGDVRYARFTRAGREARAALAAARAALARGDVAAGHDAVAAALRDYLTAKLDLPPGTIGETAPAALRAARVDGTVADQVAEFFDGCEATRYAPGGASQHDLAQALARADAIVQALERARGIAPARALGVAAALALAARAFAGGGESASALFIRANGLYGDGRYAEAASTYEQILAGGVESGAVHYNLGNAYLKAGDVGRAVLAYERARRLIPADPDLAANLGFAHDAARDVAEPALVARLVFPLAERATTGVLAVAAAAAWWVMWLALGAAALWPPARSVARGLATAGAVALAVTGSSGLHRWWTLERPATAVVVAREDVTVRSEPSRSATALFVATPGTVLQIERTRDEAALVTSRDGRRGWLATASLARL